MRCDECGVARRCDCTPNERAARLALYHQVPLTPAFRHQIASVLPSWRDTNVQAYTRHLNDMELAFAYLVKMERLTEADLVQHRAWLGTLVAG